MRTPLTRNDWLVTIAATALVVGCAFSLYLDASRKLVAEGDRVGVLQHRYGVSERKYAGRAVWERLDGGDAVYNFNTVRTGPGAEALIRLDDRTGIELDQDSMIVLNVTDDAVEIELRRGLMRLERSGRDFARGVTLKSGERTLRFAAGDMRMTGDAAGDLEVVSALGDVKLIDEPEETVRSGERAHWGPTGPARIEEIRYFTLSPERGRSYVIDGELAPIEFTFQRPAQPGPARIQIAADPYFRNIERSEIVAGASLRIALPPGLYYWRAMPEDGLEGASDSARFRVIRRRPIRIVTPRNESLFRYSAEAALVSFSWAGAPDVSEFYLELFADPDLRERILHRRVQGRGATLPFTAGSYYFRVRSIGGSTGGADVSPVYGFRVEQTTSLAAPELRLPLDGQTLSAARSGGVGFLWSRLEAAAAYEFQLARTPEFSDVLEQTRTSANGLRLSRMLEPGVYYWRVRALGAAETETAMSTAANFRIEAVIADATSAQTAPETTAPAAENPVIVAGAQKPPAAPSRPSAPEPPAPNVFRGPLLKQPARGATVDMSQETALRFRWNAAPGADVYVLRLVRGRTSAGALIHEQRVASNRLDFTDLRKLDVGDFTWTIEALDANGAALARESALFRITLSEELESPELIIKEEGQ